MRKKIVSLLLLFFCSLQLEAAEVVFITGANRGIGYSVAYRLASQGYIVYAGARKTSSLKSLLQACEQFPKNMYIVEIDVTDQKLVDQAVNTVISREGRIDVLVNNAGIEILGSMENHTIEEAQRLFDVNFFGPMRLSQAVLPYMRAQSSGRIIQISSRSGFRPLPSISIYAATKCALEGVSETMAATLKPWNIKVSLIEPGPVSTELDFLAPYGSKLSCENDPFKLLFHKAGLLDPVSPIAQTADEIAVFVQEAIEANEPLFRYQTTKAIQQQAQRRLIDISGLSNVKEWDDVLYP
ncbi:MAG: SDR family oxidoreductase [Parachlamydiaceae bacterium]|nr:SDR family oxidoreductase [Parachlamydiaceae bacterium]